jgi:hypothetical protein
MWRGLCDVRVWGGRPIFSLPADVLLVALSVANCYTPDQGPEECSNYHLKERKENKKSVQYSIYT